MFTLTFDLVHILLTFAVLILIFIQISKWLLGVKTAIELDAKNLLNYQFENMALRFKEEVEDNYIYPVRKLKFMAFERMILESFNQGVPELLEWHITGMRHIAFEEGMDAYFEALFTKLEDGQLRRKIAVAYKDLYPESVQSVFDHERMDKIAGINRTEKDLLAVYEALKNRTLATQENQEENAESSSDEEDPLSDSSQDNLHWTSDSQEEE